jgi:hypothetical protein
LWVVQLPLLLFTLFVNFPVDLVDRLGIIVLTTRLPPGFPQINDVLNHETDTVRYFALINDTVQSAEV